MECTYKYMQMDDDANEILGWHGGGVQIQGVSIYVEHVSRINTHEYMKCMVDICACVHMYTYMHISTM